MFIFVWSSYYFLESTFCTGAFSIDPFQDFNGTNMCIGGAPELKTVEIVMKNNEFEIVPRGPTGAIRKF